MTKQWYLRIYHKHSKADKYIIGFEYHGLVYTKVLNRITPDICTLDTTGSTRGNIEKLRLSIPQKKAKQWAKGNTPLCSIDDLYNDRFNKGEIFESLVCTAYGELWERDNKPFYECGDFVHDCISYQVKYNRATIATKDQLQQLRKSE